MYMQDYDVLIDKESSGRRAVYAFAMPVGPKHDKCPISMPYFMHEQPTGSYRRQMTYTVGLPR